MSASPHPAPPRLPAAVLGSARARAVRLILGEMFQDYLSWTERAACRGHDRPDLFFPQPARAEADAPRSHAERRRRITVAEAKAICRRCPVRAPDWPTPDTGGTGECLAYAEAVGDFNGIWGGKTARERGRRREPR